MSQIQIFHSLGRFPRVISHSNGKLTGTARISFGVRYARLAETLVRGGPSGGGGRRFQWKIGKERTSREFRSSSYLSALGLSFSPSLHCRIIPRVYVVFSSQLVIDESGNLRLIPRKKRLSGRRPESECGVTSKVTVPKPFPSSQSICSFKGTNMFV